MIAVQIPLVRNRSKQDYCCQCKSFIVDGQCVPSATEGGRTVVASGSPVRAPAPVAAAASPVAQPAQVDAVAAPAAAAPAAEQTQAERIAAQRAKSDRASKAIADKLLAGWKLLNDACPYPGCAVPLLENKQKQKFCVGCENWVVTEAEARQMKLSATPPAGGASAPSTPVRAPSKATPPSAGGTPIAIGVSPVNSPATAEGKRVNMARLAVDTSYQAPSPSNGGPRSPMQPGVPHSTPVMSGLSMAGSDSRRLVSEAAVRLGGAPLTPLPSPSLHAAYTAASAPGGCLLSDDEQAALTAVIKNKVRGLTVALGAAEDAAELTPVLAALNGCLDVLQRLQ